MTKKKYFCRFMTLFFWPTLLWDVLRQFSQNRNAPLWKDIMISRSDFILTLQIFYFRVIINMRYVNNATT